MESINVTIQEVLGLRGLIEYIIFKPYFQEFDFPKGMNETHLKALMNLRFTGASPMSEVSRRLSLEKGSFTPVANRLIDLNLIVKRRSEKDKRVYLLELTEEGRSLTQKVLDGHHVYIESLLENITDKEQKAFFEAVVTVRETLKKMAVDKKVECK